MKTAINVEDKIALLEITLACITGCKEYCYRFCGKPNLDNKLHVPLDLLISRVKWLKKFTDVEKIIFVGGEPLLYPQFNLLCNEIMKLGFKLGVITSGKVDRKHEENIDILVRLFKENKISVDLSYHFKLNEKFYFKLFRKLENAVRENLETADLMKTKINIRDWEEARKERSESITEIARLRESRKIFSTATVGMKNIISEEEYISVHRKISLLYNSIELEGLLARNSEGKYDNVFEYHKRTYLKLLGHGEKILGESISYDTNEVCKLGLNFRVWGAVGIKKETIAGVSFNNIVNGSGWVCPASNYKFKNQCFLIDTVTVRTDGEMCFSKPMCISAKEQFGNIDKIKKKGELITRMRKMFDLIKGLGISAKRNEKSETLQMRCNSDCSPLFSGLNKCNGYCNTGDMCSICNTLRY